MKLRNSVKAIIIDEGQMLFVKKQDPETGEEYYLLPGGGQSAGETFVQTVKRECREELGADVDAGELVLVREYISKNHEHAYKDSEAHQVEYMFRCKLKSPAMISEATELDPDQIGLEWIKLIELKSKNIFPKILRIVISCNGEINAPVYLGDVN